MIRLWAHSQCSTITKNISSTNKGLCLGSLGVMTESRYYANCFETVQRGKFKSSSNAYASLSLSSKPFNKAANFANVDKPFLSGLNCLENLAVLRVASTHHENDQIFLGRTSKNLCW